MTIDPVSLGVTVALTAASMALQATAKIEGPRLDDLSVSVADYGTPLNYFWGKRRFEGCAIIWAEPMKEVKKTSKTKGGKQSQYVYFATFDVVIADHQIDGVTRIWFDKNLVYDKTGAGPVTPYPLSFTSGMSKAGRPRSTNVNLEDHLRIYTGTPDQMPDPRMEATVDAEFGPGSTPAYRNISHMVLEELPTEKFGNRIPQVSVEAVAASAATYPYERKTTGLGTGQFSFSPDGSRMLIVLGVKYEIWDTATRELMIAGTLDYGAVSSLAVSNTGSIYYVTYDVGPAFNDSLVVLNPDGVGTAATILLGMSARNCQCLEDKNGDEYILVGGSSVSDACYLLPLSGLGSGAIIVPGFNVTGGFTDGYGDIWIYGSKPDATSAHLKRVVDVAERGTPSTVSVAGTFAGAPGVTGAMHVPSANQYFLRHQGKYHLIDDTTLTETSNGTWNGAANQDFLNVYPGNFVWTFGGGAARKISAVDGSILEAHTYSDWGISTGIGAYSPVCDVLVGFGSGPTLDYLYLNRLDGDTVMLGTICTDVCGRAGADLANVDASALTQTVRGWSCTQGPARDWIEPLLDVHDAFVRPHDFMIQFRNRGGDPSGTIDVSEFVRDGDDRYRITIKQDTDLPRSLAYAFADELGDQQTNVALVQRPLDAIDGARELSINMTTLALLPDEAMRLAERWFRRKWFGREEYHLGLTMRFLALEPGDRKYLNFGTSTRDGFLNSMTLQSGGVIRTEWESDDGRINALSNSVGAEMEGRDPEVIPISSLTKPAVLDVPLARDSHNTMNPMIYTGAGSYPGTYWAGADYAVSDSGDYEDYVPGFASIGGSDGMDWGYATEPLGTALPWCMDRGNSLNVSMKSGTLESVTEAEILEDATLNLILVGREYVQFATAFLETDGSYTLSGLLRGRRGTEAQIGAHLTGDTVIVFNERIFRHEMGADEIGDTDYYRAVSIGRDLDSAATEAVTFTAASLRPYAAVHGRMLFDVGTGDWTIDAMRRTRIGGANLDGTDVPLGETAESWSLDILDGDDVVRTITSSSLPIVYDSTMSTADFGSPPTSLSATLYQVSPMLSLRGYPLALAA